MKSQVNAFNDHFRFLAINGLNS